MEKLKYELNMDHQMRMNKKNEHIQDSRAYFNDELNKKKKMEEIKFNEKFTKLSTSFNLKDEERREEYRKKFLKIDENIKKNCDSYLEFNSNKEGFRHRYGNQELYEQFRNKNMSKFNLFFLLILFIIFR